MSQELLPEGSRVYAKPYWDRGLLVVGEVKRSWPGERYLVIWDGFDNFSTYMAKNLGSADPESLERLLEAHAMSLLAQ